MALLMFRRGVVSVMKFEIILMKSNVELANVMLFRQATDAVKKFVPLFDRLLVEKFAPETKTKGGIMIPEKAQGKVLEAVVLATGQGTRTDEGKIIPLSVKVGDHVLLPEYGGTKVSMENKDYFIFRESDILGKWNE
ncbi:10 kDa heat shock protein, mitochondrial [Trichinella sp. T8]|nr:10 kDa heat shock protein, mitochondrial [Trichinella sp. T8]